jgi:hypothetical protein
LAAIRAGVPLHCSTSLICLQAWVVYLAATRGTEAVDAAAFVDKAMRVLDALGAACTAAGGYQERALVAGEGELGMGTGSGERPHAQVGLGPAGGPMQARVACVTRPPRLLCTSLGMQGSPLDCPNGAGMRGTCGSAP